MTGPLSRWYPIAASTDLQPRHVFHGQLLGRELAVWRADDGIVNVWENRCLHRGLRLTIGHNLGTELRCQYHGWRYASGTAACTYIPAHPANAPARTIRNRSYPAVERNGLIWSSLEPEGEAPALDLEQPLVLRAVAVNAPAALVEPRLPAGAIFFVQPVDAGRCLIRGLVPGEEGIAALRRWDRILKAVRDAAEAEAPATVPAEPIVLPSLPAVTVPGAERSRGPALRVRVARKWPAGEGVVGLRLEPLAGALPPPAPGAHIDLQLPNGLVRQYSLINGPDETDAYLIGVKREAKSSGGSAAIHDGVREGDLLAVSPPHDNFRLARNAAEHLLIAGGIGLTPLLAMAKSLAAAGRRYRFAVFAREPAFADQVAHLGERHVALGREAILARIGALLERRGDGAHLYVCGPAGLMTATQQLAEAAGWPADAVHVEHFANDRPTDSSSTFEVALARSALTVTIPAGRTIVDVLRDHGVEVPTSCEQGACGTCVTTVLEGEPDHQDVYLSKAEHASAKLMTPCISRAKSPRLVLDL